jgi:hypothetical protein
MKPINFATNNVKKEITDNLLVFFSDSFNLMTDFHKKIK